MECVASHISKQVPTYGIILLII